MEDIRFRYRRQYIMHKEIKKEYYTLQEVERKLILDSQYIVTLSRDRYTGLRDKKKKKIYENDIVSINKGKPFVIEFDRGNACFTGDGGNKYFSQYLDMLEVIGNIYENLNLLN